LRRLGSIHAVSATSACSFGKVLITTVEKITGDNPAKHTAFTGNEVFPFYVWLD